MTDIAILMIAVFLLGGALYLFQESRAFLSWVQGGAKHRLNAFTGHGILAVLMGAAIYLWLTAWVLNLGFDPGEVDLFFWPAMWARDFAVLLLLLSLPAAGLALFKFAMALPMASIAAGRSRATRAISRSPMVALVGFLIALINFAASLAGIWAVTGSMWRPH